MKKLLSLVFGLAILATSVTTAEAGIKISGDAQVRPRGEFTKTKVDGEETQSQEELYWLYRLRLKIAADLGEGFFLKALLANHSAGWFATIGGDKGPAFPSNLSDFGPNHMYFGRMMQNSHYVMGWMPVNSFNNPIYDLTVYPSQPLGIPYFLFGNDRIFGLNYGAKVGPGELNASLLVLDDYLKDTDGFFRDEYAIHLMYKTNIGDITIDPQLLAAITDSNLFSMGYNNVAPWTFGTNVVIPADDIKFTLSGFYTTCDDSGVDYDGYLFRVKAERGPIRAWVDYSSLSDDSFGASDEYKNMYVWAQYNWKVHESSMGSFTLSPTVRYLTTDENNGDEEYQRLRTELWAQVTF
ncbi:MAG: hypothetical protein MI684_00950 [Chlorobiales bacterium]|nr:hypothetical protein [Chlorobiales bacterium]